MHDWTGLDSLVSPIISVLILMMVQGYESESGRDCLWFLPKR